jgi:hypothetical protein
VSALVKLSFELKQVSAVRRLTALHQGLDRVSLTVCHLRRFRSSFACSPHSFGHTQVNTLLFRVMHTRGEEMEAAGQDEQLFFAGAQQHQQQQQQQPPPPPPPGQPPNLMGGGMRGGADGGSGASWLNEEHIARQCPDVAAHSVHLPLLDGANPVFRFLR